METILAIAAALTLSTATLPDDMSQCDVSSKPIAVHSASGAVTYLPVNTAKTFCVAYVPNDPSFVGHGTSTGSDSGGSAGNSK